jgi:hypothetical protein
MADQPISKSDDLNAAREELAVLETLSLGVSTQIADLSRRPKSLEQIDNVELTLLEQRYVQLRAYEELAHSCYGRTVIGTDDEKDRPKRPYVYRITQANVGFADKNCFVVARNSPLATGLVTALPGDERDVTTRGGDRYLNVAEVRTFEGPVSLRSPSEKPNFRSMAIRRIGQKTPIVLEDLRSIVRRLDDGALDEAESIDLQIDFQSFNEVDCTWLSNWSGIYLGETDEQSLGHQFFTRTTEDQERALNNPRGLSFVEGIAGAGKTSVALGRLKFFANFGTGAEREYYGLQNALENDFSTVGMVGFVLSHSLKRYLKETASALGLERLPIRDFEEFRADLIDRFGIASRFRKRKGEGSSVRSRLSWLRALDIAMAHVAGTKLRENLAQTRDVPKRVADDVSRIANELLRADHQSGPAAFHLNGLAVRLVRAIAEAELQEQEAVASEQFQVREKADNEQRRREERALEREMRRIQSQAEKKNVSTLSHALLSGITSDQLISSAVTLERFPDLVRVSFGSPVRLETAQALDSAVQELRDLLSETQGRPAIAEVDLVALVIFAAMIADGFDYVEQSGKLNHLYQMRRNTAIFIDEIQDFTEIEIILMGMSATSAYHQITLSGDRCQQLQLAGAQSFDGLFPWVPRSQHNGTIFLDHNFRQRPELASLSSGFRSLILGDERIDLQGEETSIPATIYRFGDRHRLAELVLKRIQSLPHHATVAVVTPTVTEAQIWFDLLNEDLGAYHRAALMSRREDLTKRVNIHFTEVRETKGLEFDVVIVPDVGSFELGTAIGRNQAYVAISRAKHSLIIGCAIDHVGKPEIKLLEQNDLIIIRDLPSD